MRSGTPQLNSVVRAFLDERIRLGHEVGVQAVAYHQGKCVLDVCVGTYAADGRVRELTSDTPIMAYSISKGVSAVILAREMDAINARYDEPVSKYWPAFGVNGKERMTIGDALGHRGGLRAIGLNFSLAMLWHALRGNRDAVWRGGIAWIASCRSQWTQKRALYHHLSWSCKAASGSPWVPTPLAPVGSRRPTPLAPTPFAGIVGGIWDALSGGRPLQSGADEVSRLLGEKPSTMRMGGLVPDGAVACPMLVFPSVGSDWSRAGSGRSLVVGLVLACVREIFSVLEAVFFTLVGSSWAFLGVCLPSSNGCFTARAVAKMYSSLATGGAPLLTPSFTEDVMLRSMDRSRDVPDLLLRRPSRDASGFSPWLAAAVEANLAKARGLGRPERRAILGHNGIGGSVAYADLDSNLAICVLKTKYTAASSGGEVQTFHAVDQLVRGHLGLHSSAAMTS